MHELERLTLSNLGRGGAAEHFQAALDECITDIVDPNSAEKKSREITLKVTLTPNKDRDQVGITYQVKAKLPGRQSQQTLAFIGIDGEGPIAREFNPEQPKLDFQDELNRNQRGPKPLAAGGESDDS